MVLLIWEVNGHVLWAVCVYRLVRRQGGVSCRRQFWVLSEWVMFTMCLTSQGYSGGHLHRTAQTSYDGHSMHTYLGSCHITLYSVYWHRLRCKINTETYTACHPSVTCNWPSAACTLWFYFISWTNQLQHARPWCRIRLSESSQAFLKWTRCKGTERSAELH